MNSYSLYLSKNQKELEKKLNASFLLFHHLGCSTFIATQLVFQIVAVSPVRESAYGNRTFIWDFYQQSICTYPEPTMM